MTKDVNSREEVARWMGSREADTRAVREFVHSAAENLPELTFLACGEVSNTYSQQGSHLGFDLTTSDGETIRCFLGKPDYSNVRRFLGRPPEDYVTEGSYIGVSGHAGVYKLRCQLQVLVTRISPMRNVTTSRGAVRRRHALELGVSEEIISHTHGRSKDLAQKWGGAPLDRVLVLTGDQSDASEDILMGGLASRSGASYVSFEFRAVPTAGTTASLAIAEALRSVKKSDACLVLLARGGGLVADFDTFDDLRLAQAVRDCALPVVTAVGHERTRTLVDIVAVESFATPSSAAEAIRFAQEKSYWSKRAQRTPLSGARASMSPPQAALRHAAIKLRHAEGEARRFEETARRLEGENAKLRNELTAKRVGQSEEAERVEQTLRAGYLRACRELGRVRVNGRSRLLTRSLFDGALAAIVFAIWAHGTSFAIETPGFSLPLDQLGSMVAVALLVAGAYIGQRWRSLDRSPRRRHRLLHHHKRGDNSAREAIVTKLASGAHDPQLLWAESISTRKQYRARWVKEADLAPSTDP